MLERWDLVFYLQRERHEFALAEATSDPRMRAFHRSLAISYRQRALSAQLDETTQLVALNGDEKSDHEYYSDSARGPVRRKTLPVSTCKSHIGRARTSR